jgi:hypothetical protein
MHESGFSKVQGEFLEFAVLSLGTAPVHPGIVRCRCGMRRSDPDKVIVNHYLLPETEPVVAGSTVADVNCPIRLTFE